MHEPKALLNPVPRIAAFDHVRGLAVIFMIICHTSIVFGSAAFNETLYGWVAANVFGTGPAAPVFMLLMGLFFAYPVDKPFVVKVVRGFKLFTLGILLNIARGVIPYFLADQFNPGALNGFVGLDEKVGYADGASVLWQLFYTLDILPFAGIAYILMACLQQSIHKLWQWAVISFFIVLMSPYVWGLGSSYGFFYHAFLQPLWGSDYVPGLRGDNDFPAFPWLIYPIAGFILGELIKSGMNNKQLMRAMFRYGAGLMAASCLWFFMGGTTQFGDYYRMYPGGSFITLGFALVWIAMFMWFTEKGWAQSALEKLNFWSKNITLVYCVQWVLIGFCAITLGLRYVDSELTMIALTVLVTVASYFVTVCLSRTEGFMSFLNLFTK